MKGISRRRLAAGVGSLLAAPAIVRAQGSNGVALVIGNSKYRWEAQLPNVKRDARDVAKCFEALGLRTELAEDLGLEEMKSVIGKFHVDAYGANLAAFYFAGHGANQKDTTYVVPIDADLTDPDSIKKLLKVWSIRVPMKLAAHSFLAFDACRNSPADGKLQFDAERNAYITEKGERNFIAEHPNMLIMFSTAPGQIALDGPSGQNSPFASALMRQLADPSLDFQTLDGKLRRDLLLATGGQQVLFNINGYKQSFRLNKAPGQAAPAPSARFDRSSVVELPKAYAHVAANDMALPPGLVAIRAATLDPDTARKIGSYYYTGKYGKETYPEFIAVLSVNEKGVANVLYASNTTRSGRHWSMIQGTVSGNTLSFQFQPDRPRFTFNWRDANASKVTLTWDQKSDGTKIDPPYRYTTTFNRLDG